MTKRVKPSFPELEERVLKFIRQHNLVPEKKPLLIAVSGGPDSVCLVHILGQLRDELRADLQIVHLDHQLRGEESEADARYVKELARRLDIPATVGERDVFAYRHKYRLSLEEAAREVRYTFFCEVAQNSGADRVAVGHTEDDHIETILMHLIRGSGTGGLRGLQPVNRWQLGGNRITVIRPLLTVSREETAAYCQAHQLAPRLDATNLSMSPLRNKIRQQLLPLLQEYNPAIREALKRTAQIAGDEQDLLEHIFGAAWAKTATVKNNAVLFNKRKFIALEPAVQRQLLRMGIEKLAGTLKDIEAHHIEDILSALNKPAGKTIQLLYGLMFVVEYDRYLLGTDPAALSPFPPFKGDFTLNIPGRTRAAGWTVKAEIIETKPTKTPFNPPFPKGETNRFTAYLDFKKTGGKLTIRPYRTGDRFQPLGMNKPKKLGEFMIDTRVPHAWRDRIPVVASPKQIIWVAGYRIDERVKVKAATRKVLRVVFRRTAAGV